MQGFAQADAYAGYYSLVKNGKEEPLLHMQIIITTMLLWRCFYLKGAVFVEAIRIYRWRTSKG